MVSVIIPALDEQDSIAGVISGLETALGSRGISYELIVVDDNSSDDTASTAEKMGARVVRHFHCYGYGQAIRSGMAAASHDLIAVIDADGSYRPEDLLLLLEKADCFDMVVGARRSAEYRRGRIKYAARRLLIGFCEYVAGAKIEDINSGLRIFRRNDAKRFLSQLSYGFSFTTSLTMVMLLNGYFVGYVEVDYLPRTGKSKVSHFRDSLRTLQYVFEAFARYNPSKLFLTLIVILLSFGALSIIGVLFDLGPASLWIVFTLLVVGICLLLGMSFLGMMNMKRVERLDSPKGLG